MTETERRIERIRKGRKHQIVKLVSREDAQFLLENLDMTRTVLKLFLDAIECDRKAKARNSALLFTIRYVLGESNK